MLVNNSTGCSKASYSYDAPEPGVGYHDHLNDVCLDCTNGLRESLRHQAAKDDGLNLSPLYWHDNSLIR